MSLLTDAEYRQLLDNGNCLHTGKDHVPVVRLFLAGSPASWLLTELDPEETDSAFGLSDPGTGYPELGCLSLREMIAFSERIGSPIIRDQSFIARHPVSIYARAARLAGAFTENARLLALAYAEPRLLPARLVQPQP